MTSEDAQIDNKILKSLKDHFKKVDPTLFDALELVVLPPFVQRNTYFLDLTEQIVNQQLSGKAATTIMNRFLALFPNQEVTPERVVALSPETIRNVGMSWGKVKYVQGLAQMVINKEIDFESFDQMENEQVLTELTKIKGIGKWTAEMFLMFTLAREDVFSTGDVGLKRAIQKLYNLKKEPTEKQLLKISKKWSPYRSYASRILWRWLDTNK